MHSSPKRSQDANPPVAKRVAEAFHDDGAVVRHSPGRGRLVAEVLEHILGRARIEAGAFAQPLDGGFRGGGAELASHPAQRPPHLDRAAGGIAVPEGDGPGLTRRGKNQHLRWRDVDDLPAGGAENEDLARAHLIHHLLVQLAHPSPGAPAARRRGGAGGGSRLTGDAIAARR